MQLKKFFNPGLTLTKKSVFLLLILSVFSKVSRAGDEKMNSRMNAPQMIVGACLAVSDKEYTQPGGVTVGNTAIVKNSTGKVTLALDNYASTLNYFATPTFYIKVGINITYINAAGQLSVQNKDLIIDHHASGTSSDRFDVVLKDVHVLAIQIVQFKDILGNTYVGTLPNNLYLETEIVTERYYAFNASTAPVANHFYHSGSNELEVYWNSLDGAEEYELEYTFVNNFDAANGTAAYDYALNAAANIQVLANSGLNFSFNNNATRIRTRMNNFKISLTFDRGLVAYRVRAIGRSTAALATIDLEVVGNWSYNQPQSDLSIPFNAFSTAVNDYVVIAAGSSLLPHEENKNWQLSTTFAEDGKKKEVISYFDGSLRKRQTVTRSNTEGVALIGETIYDSQGRPAINVLPSPSGVYSSKLEYYENFNQSINQLSGSIHLPFSRLDFESNGGSCPVPAAGLYASATAEGASKYYSAFNSNKENQNAYIPDAQNYPFTHNVYTPDNTGRLKYQSGVGKEHRIGNGKESKYLYFDADQDDLDKLFGAEAGYVDRYKKNMVIDPNGQISISYLNTENNVVATALGGNAPANVDQLTSHTVYNKTSKYIDYHDANYNSVNSTANGQLVFKKKIVPDVTGNYTFFYDITAPQFNDPICIPNFCYDCIYDLEITLKDECNTTVYSQVTPVGSFGSLDYTCGSHLYFSSTGFSPAFVQNLTAGKEYFLTKVLSINTQAKDKYLEHYLNPTNNTCIKTLTQFETTEISTIDFSGCGLTCQSCSTKVEQYALAHSVVTDPDYMSPGQKKVAIEQCMKPCKPVTLCQTEFEMMLQDMRPQGQYAQYNVALNGAYSAATYELSIFNDNNYLRLSTIYGGPTNANGTPFVSYDISKKSHWRNPEYYNTSTHNFTSPDPNATKFHYFEEDGSVSKIRLVQLNSGFYPNVLVNTITTNSNIAGVYSDNIGYWTYPENLMEMKDFAFAYSNNKHWAFSLVKNHPEFNYFLDCDRQSNPTHGTTVSGIGNYTSEQFDIDLRLADSFDEANGTIAGINFGNSRWPSIAQSSPNDPSLDLITKDPYFNGTAGASLYSVFLSRISNFQGTGKSIKEIAAEMYTTGNMFYSGCASTFGALSLPCIPSVPHSALDDMWKTYRELYITEKQKLIMEQAHATAAQPLVSSQNNYFNGAIGDLNFSPLPASIAYGFNTWLVLSSGFPYSMLGGNSILYTPSIWPNYHNSYGGFPAGGAIYHPPYGLGYLDFGSPSSFYHKGRYANKTRRVPDLQTFSNSLAGGATDPADIMNGLTQTANASMYFETGQCPVYKRLEFFLSNLAKKGAFFPFNTIVPLQFEPTFTKDLYDAVIACSSYPSGTWFPLGVSTSPVGNTYIKIHFFDLTNPGTPLHLAFSDIEINSTLGTPITNWDDLKLFSNISATGSNNPLNYFNIKGYYEPNAQTASQIFFSGSTCIQNNCPNLADTINLEQCSVTQQGLELRNFLSAVVHDNTAGALNGAWIDLYNTATSNSANFFTSLVRFPFTTAVVAAGTHSVRVSQLSGYKTIELKGKDPFNSPITVEFAFQPVVNTGNQDLQGALALSDIKINQTSNNTYDFFITAYYASNVKQKFKVKVNYTGVCSNIGSCKFYLLKSCHPYVPVQCESNNNYKTKIQLENLLNEIFLYGNGYGLNNPIPITYLANYSTLLQSQIGFAANACWYHVSTLNGVNSSFNHTVSVKFFKLSGDTSCTVSFTLNNFLSNSSMNSVVPNWRVENIVPNTPLSSAFTATIGDGIYTYAVYGEAPCFKMQICESCDGATYLVNEDFESYTVNTLVSQFNFTTERHDAGFTSICNYGPWPLTTGGGFNSIRPSYPDWNLTNLGEYSIQSNTVQTSFSDHTPGSNTTQYLSCYLSHTNSCAGPPNFPQVGLTYSTYVIPWQTKTPLATNIGSKYRFSVYFKNEVECNYEIQLIVNDGVNDIILATKKIDVPGFYINKDWVHMITYYTATSTSTQFKIKIVPSPISSNYTFCSPYIPNHFEQWKNIALDDITVKEMLCENKEIIPITYTETPNDDCYDQLINIAKANAKRKYDQFIDNTKKDFNERYTKKCYETQERLTADYQSSEGHYTLYYYDQAGNLIKTVPPEGVEIIDLNAIDPVFGLTYGTLIANDRIAGTQNTLTKHRMATRYEYNSLNQLVRQQMPDHSNTDLFGNTSLTSLPGVSVKGMDFSNPTQGYLIGSNAGVQSLYVTTNGGTTWNPASLLSTANIIDVDYCVNSNTNVAIGILSDGSLVKSTNYSSGSPVWQVYNIPGGNNMQFTDIQFFPATAYGGFGSVTGFITGKNGLLLVTGDNGDTWTAMNLNTTNDLNHIDIKGTANNWYAVAVGNNGTVYYNTLANNFNFWQQYTQVNTNVDLLNCSILYAGAGMNIVASGVDKNLSPNRGTVLNISNMNSPGSSVVTNLYLHPSGSYSSKIEALISNKYTSSLTYTDVVFGGVENGAGPINILGKLQAVSTTPGVFNPVALSIGNTPAMQGVKDLVIDNYGNATANIYGVTANAKFFKLTSANAVTPNNIVIGSTPVTTQTNKLNLFQGSLTNGLIAGNAGNLLSFVSTGPSFNSQSSITLPVLNAIKAAKDGSGRVYAVGNTGKVWFSTNFGNSWQQTTVGSANLQAVEYIPNNPAKIVVAGNAGYIAEMLCNNLSFQAINNGGNSGDTYYSIAMPNANTSPVFIAGGTGTTAKVYKYTSPNNGLVLATQPLTQITVLGSPADVLNKIVFTTNNTAFAVGNNGTILKSSNNGTSFFSLNSGTTCAFSDLLVIDPNTAYAFGTAAIFKTTNGVSWTSMASPNSNISTVYNFGNGNIMGGGSGTTNLFKLFDQSGDYASRFFYDQLGRLIISQNAKQFNKTSKAYSYTKYDALGRITEVGEVAGAALADPMTLSANINGVIASSAYASWLAGGTKTEVTKTLYDDAAASPSGFVQDNLRKRVSVSYLDDDDNLTNGYKFASYYSYDIHGNVKSLLQENTAMPSGHTCKKIDYTYDLISGKVNSVSYQNGQTDAFHHKYEYDADNRITNVYSSKDGVSWSQDAKYFYYLHGPLARVELGNDKIQGLDYAYTLQGWIKGINSVSLSKNNDIGKDGLAGSQYNSTKANLHKYVTDDAAAYALNYYNYNAGAVNDYTAIDAAKNTSALRFDGDVSAQGHFTGTNSLYNGNIMAMATTIYNASPASASPLPQLSTYKYDQLNRIKKMQSSTAIATNAWTGNPSASDYRNEFTYDANGNIMTQKTYNNTSAAVDDLSYRYLNDANGKKVSNRLYHVNDAITAGVATYDIDDQGTYGSVANNYDYDQIGNLIRDNQEEIATIDWTVYGKIKSITRTGSSTKQNLIFDYDASGNRVSKTRYTTTNLATPLKWVTTFYVRDAQGNVMATYDYKQDPGGAALGAPKELSLIETPIYGSSRLGMRNYGDWNNLGSASAYHTTNSTYTSALKSGDVSYELSNHLGNVITVISDRKLPLENLATPGTVDRYVPDVLSATDYYPFGQPMPGRQFNNGSYRYGFNRQEKDDEVAGTGNIMTADFWEYDTRLGRRWNTDPVTKHWMSPYHAFSNKPILNIDPNGANDDEYDAVYNEKTKEYDKTKISTKGGDAADLTHYKGGALDGQHMVFNNSKRTATWFGGSNGSKGSTSKALVIGGGVAGTVDQSYGAWQNEKNQLTYTQTNGKTARMYTASGDLRSATAAKKWGYIKTGGLGLNFVSTGFGYAILYNQSQSAGTIDKLDATEVGIGTVGTVANGMSYFGWGGTAAATVGTATGFIGLGIQSGKIWYGFYKGMQDMEWNSKITNDPGEAQWNQWQNDNGVINEGDLYSGH